MSEWFVTMENSEGLKFKDYFEGQSLDEVKLAAERYFINATFIDAEQILD